MTRHRHRPPQSHRLATCLSRSSLLLVLWLAVSQAQVRTTLTADGTLGTTVTPHGPLYTITGGTRPGNGPNLFHSFDRFSVGTNETARFSGPTGIVNILSRVTGGQESMIDGRLQSTIPGANLYLLNPSGVLFGPNAKLDLSGSFHVSTADMLRLADGATFSAHRGERSTLTTAPPVAFGFWGPTPATITVQGSALAVSEGNTVSVVGGEIQIIGGQLVAPSGRVQIASVASAGEVGAPLLEQSLDVEGGAVPRGGRLVLSERGSILAQTAGAGPGGEIVIQTGTLQLTGQAQIGARSTSSAPGAGRAGRITVVASDVLLTEGGSISVSTSAGPGGEIVIQTGTLQLTGSQPPNGQPARINGSTGGPGPGGRVTVVAREVQLTDAGLIEAQTSGAGPGSAIAIQTGTLQLTGQAQIRAQTTGAGPGGGSGGAIAIQTGTLQLTGQAQINSSSTLIESSVPGGRVTVVAREVQLTERGSILAQTAGAGPGGEIVIQTGTLQLTGQAQISSGSSPKGQGGPGGSITVRAREKVEMVGEGPDRLATDIDSNTSGRGDGGQVVISAPTVSLKNGHIRASSGGGSSGRGGGVEVRGDTVTLREGSDISTDTSGTGRGGDVTVVATEAISIRGSTMGSSATNPSRGDGGRLFVAAPMVSLEAGSTIGSNTSGPGTAGVVEIQAGTLRLTGAAQISGSSFSEGQGGSITVRAQEAVQLSNEGSLLSNARSGGDGGKVVVFAPTVALENGRIQTRTTGDGNAGTVDIHATRVTLTGRGAEISSSSGNVSGSGRLAVGAGRGGNVTVTAQTVTVTDGRLTTETFGPGAAGDLTLNVASLMAQGATLTSSSTGAATGNAGTVRLQGPGGLGTTATQLLLTRSTVGTAAARADGGDIEVRAQHLLRLRDSTMTTAVGGGPATVGGNITIDPEFIVLQNSQIIATAFEGKGGRISLQAEQVVLVDPTSLVSAAATSKLGINGQVAIQAPVTSISGAVAPLPQAFASAAALLRSPCAARLHEGTVSTLVERGRDGMPATPDGVLPSRLPLPLLDTATPSHEGGLPSTARVWSLEESPHDPSGPLALRGWAASVDAFRLLPGECASH